MSSGPSGDSIPSNRCTEPVVDSLPRLKSARENNA